MQTVRVDSIKPNPDNPRIIKDDQYARLLASIKRDPAFLEVRGIVHADGVVLGGNMRLRAVQEALKDAAFRDAVGVPAANVMPAAWVQDASAWDAERRRRFIIVDNSPDGLSGEWDWDALANEWDEDMLRECGIITQKNEGAKPPTVEIIPDAPPPPRVWVWISLPTESLPSANEHIERLSGISGVNVEMAVADA